MNYEEARGYIDEAAKYGSELGLENMRELLSRLGNPQDDLKFIHISGTNGKGSVLAYLSTILKEAGYRVGRYISPTLFSYREKIQVNEEYIEKESLAKLVTRIQDAIDQMVEDGKIHPTVFEIETALAFLYFKEKKCEIVVLETGLGGTDDATNIISTTVMEVLVSISMDHMQYLGNTLGEIASKKAGIIKKNTAVVTVRQEPEAMEVIKEKVKEMQCTLDIAEYEQAYDVQYGLQEQRFSYGKDQDFVITLAGSYQIKNAVIAVKAVETLRRLGYEISDEQLRAGLRHAIWRGRFTVLSTEPLIIMDGAHNRDAALKLEESIQQYFKGRRLFYLCGMFQDKEYDVVLQTVAPYCEAMIAIETPGNPRALPAEQLAKEAGKYIKNVQPEKSIRSAVEKIISMADQQEDVILAFGSLSFLGVLERIVKQVKENGHD